jgi:hypothetical protein
MTDAPINFPVPARPKDPTAAERQRRHRARKRALVPRDPSTVTARGTSMISAPTVADEVTTVTAMPFVMADRSPVTGRRAVVLPAVLMVTALGLGATGLIINARFAASFGQTPDAAILLAAIGVALDVLAMTLPATAAGLWSRGRRLLALVAWLLLPAVLTMVLLASTGFASQNLGDGIAGRARVAETVADLRQDLERLRRERGGIAEQRSIGEIAAAIEQTRVAPWALPCTSPDTAEARRACSPILALRQALESSRRRDSLDVRVRQAEAKLERLPAVGLSDPTTFAAEIVTSVTAGRLAPTAADIYRIRIIGLVVAPSAAGLVMMLGIALAGRRP